MSKASELRVLRYGRSVDAPINYHHRTGDSEGSAGSMLDFYAQTESAEEIFLQEEDEQAREKFVKGFKGYLRKVFSKTEREFLRRLMSGREQPREVARALGVDWFKYMQTLQHKAYKNVKPLLRLSELTGWSRAGEFTAQVLRRLSLLENGAELGEILPNFANRAKVRESLKKAGAITKAEKNAEKYIAAHKYYIAHREECRAKVRQWIAENYEHKRAYDRKYQAEHREEVLEKKRQWAKKWRKENPEKKRAENAAYRAKACAGREVREYKLRELCVKDCGSSRSKEYRSEYQKAYRAENREKSRKYQREYIRAYRERKKAEHALAKAAAAVSESVALSSIADILEGGSV